MWKNLPDDVINAVCEYWSPQMEMVYRRMKKMDGVYIYQSNFEDKAEYVNKLRFLPIPERIRQWNIEATQNNTWRVILSHIKYTNTMCVLTVSNANWPRKQINFKKKTLQEFHSWVEDCVVPRWRDIVVALNTILKKKYPVMSKYIKNEDNRKSLREFEEMRRLQQLNRLCPDPRRLFN
jgi:hypothetical protein